MSSSKIIGGTLEVCFVDVGQGTSNVILLGDRRAIGIDCGGAKAKTVLALLRRFQIETLTRLIISHSHDDHSRGAAAVLTAFQGRIDEIWMLDDVRRPESLFWQRVLEELRAGRLDRRQIYLLVREDKPRQIYRDERILLSLIAPDCVTNFCAIDDRNPNFTSAVLILKRGKQQILFAGDSTIGEWQDIMLRRKHPFKCEVLVVPHHAGGVWLRQQSGESKSAFESRVRAELDWLYSQAINAGYGIVSVGTSNQHKHPRPEVMAALGRAKVVPICTQMTKQCCSDLEAQRVRSLPLILPSRSLMIRDMTGSNRSRNVACAATVLVELRDDGISIQRFADHQAMIDRLNTSHGGSPLCRARM
ncbi:MAG TPA: MBL fold metallo-hydrolase [Gemmataceae bacterium]|nr:MBL fold metallo-hydrolase [Gemmataceae bacterium]